ncbi:MAG: PAS domain-containing protein [Proteobacteria bacterium]|nr:PAS domain-containing protein [Pseudomonadota bacterium]
MKEKQRFLENIFDAIQDGIIVLDRNHNIVLVNRWMERKYASEMPLVGKKCYAVFQKRQDYCPAKFSWSGLFCSVSYLRLF